jgi:hypothetical protein
MEKHKKFLLVYAIIIVIIFICIMFVIPDSFFMKKYEENAKEFVEGITESQKTPEFTDYEEQKSHLLNGSYEYEIMLLDSTQSKGYVYECSGKVEKQKESGVCTSPELVSYTNATKKTVLNKINTTYIEPKGIFETIKNVEPEIESHKTYREYTYNVKINGLETEIIVQTLTDEISKIFLNNVEMQYILKYSNMNY